MLDEKGIPYEYREYRLDPLSEEEIRAVLKKLRLPASGVLRKGDRANKELGLTGEEPEVELIRHMARQPTLLQRPIAILGDEAVLGRPVERVLELPVEPGQ